MISVTLAVKESGSDLEELKSLISRRDSEGINTEVWGGIREALNRLGKNIVLNIYFRAEWITTLFSEDRGFIGFPGVVNFWTNSLGPQTAESLLGIEY